MNMWRRGDVSRERDMAHEPRNANSHQKLEKNRFSARASSGSAVLLAL